jgi:hypothetical protein
MLARLLVRILQFPQAAGGAQDDQNVARNWIVLVDTLHAIGS